MASFDPTFSAEELQNEEWRAIPNFEGYYEASSLGNIRNIAARRRTSVGHILKSHVNPCVGRRAVRLKVNGKGKTYSVHGLVAEAFLGPRPKGLDVNHIDGNALNNRASNLEYLTRKENIRHAVRIGLWFNGEKHWKTTMTAEKVLELRRLAVAGESYKAIAAVFGLTPQGVGQIVRRKSWKHI
jgi:hypothetical protein